ncbi:Acyl transferase domain protein [Pseudobythopirellula maris]|uniref:[acyl-carrier-protein] S-malonyltransferase n=1 Tax=Pseudobythopirellula maris TaxID=2527991 RepID=A0A5C5ZT04_9BACT|nr:ACP S-malonyltransferase [Pseudobythopirellula maris]TWT89911.1 Acyl transferase domain protein [Pseudobythopirellula maris]
MHDGLLNAHAGSAAYAFRGYNVTNLGRTPELLACPPYRAIVERCLRQAGEACSEATGQRVDLVNRVVRREEADLPHYAEAVAIVFAAELAQIELLREAHGVDFRDGKLALGYSLGELAALACAGAASPETVLSIPLAMAADCASLAGGSEMGVVFSRGEALDENAVGLLCEEVTADGAGTVAISAVLSPNTLLVIGQGQTIAALKGRLRDRFARRVNLRLNDSSWPPLHTPIVRQKHVPDRASLMIERLKLCDTQLRPRIVSLVTGQTAYHDGRTRQLLRDWVDHPQRLWDGVRCVLSSGAGVLVHVGPEPNLIPATFRRLAENVRQQTSAWSLSGMGMRAIERATRRPWLGAMLPVSTSLLRAPNLKHVVLEDWLLEHAPG